MSDPERTLMNLYGTATAADTVRIERLLPATIERVWEYLTDPGKRRLWLASGPMQLSANGDVELIFRTSELTRDDDPAPAKYAREAGEVRTVGRIVEFEPPRLLAFTWGGTGDDASQVRFELSARGERTHLRVTHCRLSTREAMLSVAGGWHTHLDILVARLDGREPDGFWRTHTRLEAEYDKLIPAR